MHHVRLLLSTALLSLATMTGCGPDAEDTNLDVQTTPSDPFDRGASTDGELGEARFQMGSCAPLALGHCDLNMPLMTGYQTTLLVDVLGDTLVADVESSDPEVLAAGSLEPADLGYQQLPLEALAPGEVTLTLLRNDGSVLDRVELSVATATDLRWTVVRDEEPDSEERDGDGEVSLRVGEQVQVLAQPIDATGRIVNGFGAMNARLVDDTSAVELTGNEGSYFVGLEGLGVGQAKLELSTGEALIELVVDVVE